jgi:hypothetical protein
VKPISFTYYFLVFLLIGCLNHKKEESIQNNKSLKSIGVSKTQEKSYSIAGKVFIVKDSTKYSQTFIKELKKLNPSFESITLADEKIFISSSSFTGTKYINNLDTVLIPIELPLNKVVIYKAEKDGKNYILSLRRINYTNIEYELRINASIIKSGQVILNTGYILGMETEEDENGSAYGVIQYLEENDCWTSLGIEINSGKRVSFSVLCEGDKQKSIDNLPILTRE